MTWPQPNQLIRNNTTQCTYRSALSPEYVSAGIVFHREDLRAGSGGAVPGPAGFGHWHLVPVGPVGWSRDPHLAVPYPLWVLHLLHLQCTSPQAEAERLGWKLCSWGFIHCTALVGRTGGWSRGLSGQRVAVIQALEQALGQARQCQPERQCRLWQLCLGAKGHQLKLLVDEQAAVKAWRSKGYRVTKDIVCHGMLIR